MIKKIKDFLIGNLTSRQIAAKNAFWLTLSSVGGQFVRAIIVIYAARVLGASGYGVFSYALGLAAFFTIFSDLGLNELIIREASKKIDREKSDVYFSTFIILKAALIIFAVLLTIIIAPFITKIEAAKTLIPLMALLLAFDTFRIFSVSFARAENRMDKEARNNIITNGLIVIFSLAAFAFKPSPMTLALSYTLGSGVGTALMIISVKRHLRAALHFPWFKKETASFILKTAWPLALAGIIGNFMLNTDNIIIGWFRGATELGYYAAAGRPIMLFYLMPSIIAGSIFQTLTRLFHEKQMDKIKSAMEKSLAIAIALALPLVLGGIILGQGIILLLYGKSYFPATLSFQILLLTLFAIFPGRIVESLTFIYDKQKLLIKSGAWGAISNILLDIILIPKYGIAGSAVSTAVSLSIMEIYVWHKVKQFHNFQASLNLKKIIAAAASMALLTLVLANAGVNIVVNMLLSGLFYVLLLFLMKEPVIAEIKSIFR